MITIQIINGAPERELSEQEIEYTKGFPVKYFADSIIYFTSTHVELTIDELKNKRCQEVDLKTEQLIFSGFSFDGKLFSLSDNAQRNWMGISAAISAGLLTEQDFPFTLSAKDDTIYKLSWANRNNFMACVLRGISIPKGAGTALKNQILLAQTIEEINAIVDNR
jgi:hypothetical protein